LLPCLTLCCFAFFTEALTIPWLGHDPKSWMIGRGACCLGMLLAIIASCIAWGTGTQLELLLYAPGQIARWRCWAQGVGALLAATVARVCSASVGCSRG